MRSEDIHNLVEAYNSIYEEEEYLSENEYDAYDIILSYLLDEGYANTEEAALKIMISMSEEWKQYITEDWWNQVGQYFTKALPGMLGIGTKPTPKPTPTPRPTPVVGDQPFRRAPDLPKPPVRSAPSTSSGGGSGAGTASVLAALATNLTGDTRQPTPQERKEKLEKWNQILRQRAQGPVQGPPVPSRLQIPIGRKDPFAPVDTPRFRGSASRSTTSSSPTRSATTSVSKPKPTPAPPIPTRTSAVTGKPVFYDPKTNIERRTPTRVELERAKAERSLPPPPPAEPSSSSSTSSTPPSPPPTTKSRVDDIQRMIRDSQQRQKGGK